MGRLSAALLAVCAVLAFLVFVTINAPSAPALATVEYLHDPATALLDRQAERVHAERMAEIAAQAYNDRMFWRAALMLCVLAVCAAVLGIVLSVRSSRVSGVSGVRVLPAERKRLVG